VLATRFQLTEVHAHSESFTRNTLKDQSLQPLAVLATADNVPAALLQQLFLHCLADYFSGRAAAQQIVHHSIAYLRIEASSSLQSWF
jgi:hypothetical protein